MSYSIRFRRVADNKVAYLVNEDPFRCCFELKDARKYNKVETDTIITRMGMPYRWIKEIVEVHH